MADTGPCAVLVLAAGGSLRMGRPKQLLSVGGQPMIRTAVQIALESNLRPVIVVLGAQAGRIRPHLEGMAVQVAENPAWREGMASSLRAGVAALARVAPAARGLIVMPADQPRLTSAHLRNIEAAQRASGRAIVASDYGDHRGPPAYFDRRHFPALLALHGDVGARALLGAGDVEAIAAPPGSGLDLDHPADQTRLRDT